MKKQKVTYGVYNMVEWHALLRSGKATLEVHFSNGATTTAGVTPATFTTDNPITQIMIERTAEFRGGKIKRLRVYDLGGDVVGQSNPPAPAVQTPAPAEAPAEPEEIIDGSEGIELPLLEETADLAPAVEQEEAAEQNEADPAEEAPAEAEAPKAGEVKVKSLADARIYLEENYGLTANQIRTTAQIKAAATQHGFTFVGI